MNQSNLSNLREIRAKLQQENNRLIKKQKELQQTIVVLEERVYIQDLENKQTQLKKNIIHLEKQKTQLESKLNKKKDLLEKTEVIVDTKKKEVKIKKIKKSKKKNSIRKVKQTKNSVSRDEDSKSSLAGEDEVELVAVVDSPILEQEASQKLRGKKVKKKWGLF